MKKSVIALVLVLAALVAVTVFAACDVTYTYYFEPNYDGAEQITVTVQLGEEITPPEVEREGYHLEGWYTDSECTIPYNPLGTVLNGQRFYAKWAALPTAIIAEFDGEVFVGDVIDKEDIVVTVLYFDGTSATVTDFEANVDVTDSAGTKNVSVKYTEKGVTLTATAVVVVKQPALSRITAEYVGEPVLVGGTFNVDDLVVTAYYENGHSTRVENFSYNSFSSDSAGAQVLEISYTESGVTKECSVTIMVVDESAVASGSLSIHFLELGNKYTGDSVYVKAGDTDILIDAGSRKDSASTIADYIDDYCTDGVLEYVIVTHAHQDHIAGFVGSSSDTGIFERYECENIIEFARTNATTQIYEDYCEARNAEIAAGANCYTALDCVNNANGAQKVYDVSGDGSVTMEILYQEFYEQDTSNENDYSVCVLITQGQNHYLLTGDLEVEGEESLVANNPDLPEVVLYKGGHHGSYTAAGEVLMAKIRPQYVCICTCAGTVEYTQNMQNTFPAQAFIDRVAPYTDKVYVTSLMHVKYDEITGRYTNDYVESMNGNIVFSCEDGVISLQCSNNDLKLKDTQWFKENRVCPEAWK